MRKPVVIAVALLLSALTLPTRAQQPLSCKIDRAHARVWSRINEGGQVVYYGHAIMYTTGCQGHSPADVTVTFQPMTGAASSCDPRGTVENDDAVCTTGVGAAVQGTHILITATGKTYGTGGAGAFASSCTVILPAWDNASCSFPIRLLQ